MVVLAALPFALAGFMLAPAAASDQGTSPPVDATEQADSSGPGSSAPSESTETDGSSSSEESRSTEDSSSTEGTSSSGQSSPDTADTTDPATSPEAEDQASEESSDEGSSQVTEPPATVPKVAPSQAAGARQRAKAQKFTICHRTRSETNPYNEITVDDDSLVRQGHLNHTGPIFTPTLKIRWGDIIPPVPPELPNGMNWPEGAPILNNGCEVPPPPDVGPQPGASIGVVECVGTVASVDVTVTNGADATEPANFAILVDGVVVRNVGPVPPGGSQTVTLTGDADGLQEDATITVEVQSPPGGEVITSEVITVDCADPPPDVHVTAELVCQGEVPRGTVTVTNNGQEPVVVTAEVNGTQVPPELTVAPGATETAMADLSQFEDQTITVTILVDGVEAATYTVTPDCVAPIANPSVGVSGQVCPPPSATVTLGNTGDPDSQVVFVILVDGKVVQRSSPIFGGDTTTIVGDLSQFEDQTVVVELRANGKVLGSRTIHVNCTTVAGASGSSAQPGSSSGGVLPGSSAGSGVLPSVGAGFGPSVIALGLGLVMVGCLVIVVGSRRSGPRSRQA